MLPMNPARKRAPARPVPGFTLLEVLIAILVLSIGLLGLAGLQFSALRNNTQSYERSQAVAFAYEIADRMRANRASAGAGLFQLTPTDVPVAALNCDAVPCNRAEIAQFELARWRMNLVNTLPGATASITCSEAPCQLRSRQTINIIWNENRTAATDRSCPPPASFNPDVHLACVTINISP